LYTRRKEPVERGQAMHIDMSMDLMRPRVELVSRIMGRKCLQ
jgi:hypothetical protein